MSVDKSSSLIQTPLAVVGMACRLPGADGLDQYWELLCEGRDPIGELPPDRLNRALYFDPAKGTRGKTYTTLGGLIDARPLDADVCRLSPVERAALDPCHQILCEVAAQACRHAGFDPDQIPCTNTGVYVGHSAGSPLGGEIAYATLAAETADYLRDVADFSRLPAEVQDRIVSELTERLRKDRPRRAVDGGPDTEANMAAAAVARRLKLDGPQMVIDAACASSLVALALGALDLQDGSVDMAIIGAASWSQSNNLILFSQAQSCSATGSRPFDEKADGLVSSEGYVALVVKTLSRALGDGNTVYAVLRGLGLSSDGRGRSLWAPRKEGQLAAIQRAYTPPVDPRHVQYIEAHATSTQVGDATELEALAEGFGDLHFGPDGGRIPIGSVKSNIGHTLETAGLASLLKVILAIRHQIIPPTIHLDELNRSIPWSELPFFLPTEPIEWPTPQSGQPRRAAVNAFGIGGINVHLVVDEFVDPRDAPPAAGADGWKAACPATELEPVAVVGRGVILPGAHDIDALAGLIRSGSVEISEAPDGRWRKGIGVCEEAGKPWHVPTRRGGFIRGYEYGWDRHNIPPRQIERANPLQFMLLDAASQAFREAGYDRKPFDRARTAVVVGTVFGGEFAHQLQVGLRLPELRQDLQDLLRQSMSEIGSDLPVSESRLRQILDEYEERLLRAKPALLDETGSFTSSTLASRIAKTLDLMGGTLAVDAAEASALTALSAACQLLRSGACSMVLCGAAQRAMDLPSYESLARHGSLLGSRESKPTADRDDASEPTGAGGPGYLPGEGVAMLALKRLSDARRDGDPILAVIHGVGAATAFAGSVQRQAFETAARRAAGKSGRPVTEVERVVAGCNVPHYDRVEADVVEATYGCRPSSLPLLDQIGHTQAAHGLVSLIHATLAGPHGSATAEANGTPPGRLLAMSTHGLNRLVTHLLLEVTTTVPQQGLPSVRATAPVRTFRVGARSPAELQARLEQARRDAPQYFSGAQPPAFRPEDAERVAILASDPGMLAEKVSLALDSAREPKARGSLHDQGIVWWAPTAESARIAVLFPGQGSQYPDMARALVERSPAARARMAEADAVLQTLGYETFAEMAWSGPQRLGTDIWTTQAAMLIADLLWYAALNERGLRPDCVSGHSFGEFAALVAAGVWTLEQAIRMTRARAEAIQASQPGATRMLAVNAPADEMAALIAECGLPVFLTHENAPSQSVVGGLEAPVEEFAQRLADRGTGIQRLAVPSAFHTPLLQSAQSPWRAILDNEPLLPPGVPVLSNATNRFVAEPDDVRANLVAQLVEPVRYVSLIRRLASQRTRLFLEVGPRQVLTRLNRQILAQQDVICLSADHPTRDPGEQLDWIETVWECLGREAESTAAFQRAGSSRSRSTIFRPAAPGGTPEVEEFDATLARRAVHGSASYHDGGRDALRPDAMEDFDATAPRRLRNRAADVEHSGRERVGSSGSRSEVALSHGSRNGSVDRSPPMSSPEEADHSPLAQFLIDFVVDQTGYPPHAVKLDADLEADLGIDSIKKAQLLGELRGHFELTGAERDGIKLGEYRTLRHILGLLQQLGVPDDAGRSDPAEDENGAGSDGDLANGRLGHGSGSRNGDRGESASRATGGEKGDGASANGRSAFSPRSRSEQNREVSRIAERPNATKIHSGLDSANGLPSAIAEPDSSSPFYAAGLQRGREQTLQVQKRLRRAADSQRPEGDSPHPTDGERIIDQFSPEELQELQGLADGAGVHVVNLLAYNLMFRATSVVCDDPALLAQRSPVSLQSATGPGPALSPRREAANGPAADPSSPPQGRLAEKSDEPQQVTSRYILRTAPAPQWPGAPAEPHLKGAALVLGQNSVAEALQAQCCRAGISAHVVVPGDDPAQTVAELERIWRQEPVLHLFLVTPRDSDAATTWDWTAWQQRRGRGLVTPYWLCQRWLQLLQESDRMEDASLVGVTSLGGDFGFSGQVVSAESGGLAGLLKAIVVESWVNGFRTIPIKLIDAPPEESPESIVRAIWRELAAPSYDVEVVWSGDQRSAVRAVPQAVPTSPRRPVREGGTWVCTGGARGITAYVVRELATRYGLTLHLIGTAPPPEVPDAWRNLSDVGSRRLKRQVMQAARAAGRNALKEWQQTEKALEIDATLREMASLGIRATYHQCDVADRDRLDVVLRRIRKSDGPISGILHGAGIGQDARFDRKDPPKVEQCLRAKIDGALALMDLTREDPLEHFVAFGSISGRFGANGHTDYSLANDMLAKQVDWFRSQRPDVAAVAFHWHAWGDIGMATKPETKLALEMIDMQFMPAREGLEHLIAELEAGAPQGEVLITDERYCRSFYPADTRDQEPGVESDAPACCPLLIGGTRDHSGDWQETSIVLDPVKDPFLAEHRLDDKPLLPFVIGIELLCEAARQLTGAQRVRHLRDMQAVNGLHVHSERPQTVRTRARPLDGARVACELVGDFRARDGSLVEPDRLYFKGVVEFQHNGAPPDPGRLESPDGEWCRIVYPERGSTFYAGSPLRCLRTIQTARHVAWGRIAAPALGELAGPRRPVRGWVLPSAALDACLYAVGYLAWEQVERGPALPVGLGRLDVGRLPWPGEPCLVEVRFRRREGRFGWFDFALLADNGDRIVHAVDYRIAWLTS